MADKTKRGKLRLDDLLVKRGIFSSRDEAARACIAGDVTSNDLHISGPAQLVPSSLVLRVKKPAEYVSRGGDKLAGALEELHFSPASMRCIDVGASSGGFTDCLLQHGASEVVAVDVGYSQFAWTLRCDDRVKLFERTNIRLADPSSLGAPFGLLVADVSFISLASLLAKFVSLVGQHGFIIALVKPQFEINQELVGKNGVVREASEHINVLKSIMQEFASAGIPVQQLVPSRLRGPKGNIEFFVMAQASAEPVELDIERIVLMAHEDLGGESCMSSLS